MSNKLLIGSVVIVVAGLLIFMGLSGNKTPANSTASVNDSLSANSAKADLAPLRS